MENEISSKRDRRKLPNFEDYELKHFDISVGGRLFPFDCWMDKDDPESYLMHVKRGQRLGSFIEQYVSLIEKMREPLGFIKGIACSIFAGVVIAFLYNALWTKAFGFAPKAGEEWNIFLGIIGASSLLFEFFKAKSNSPSSGSPGCLGVIALLFAPLVVGLAAWGVGCLVHSYIDWFPENAIWWFIMALPLIQLVFIAIFFLAWIAAFAQFKKFKSENKHTLSSLDIVQINEILEELEVPERMFLDKEWETAMVIT